MSYDIRERESDPPRRTYGNGKNFGAWSTKVFAALDEADALRITQRKETIPVEVLPALDALGNVNNQAQMDENVADLKDFGKRFKRGVSIPTQSIDDSLVQLLNSVPRHPADIWEKIERDFNKVSPGITHQMKEELRAFHIDPNEDAVLVQHRLELLVDKCRQKKYFPTDEDVSMTLLDALDESYESLRNTYWVTSPLPSIGWIYTQIDDKKRRAKRSEGAAHGAALAAKFAKTSIEGYYGDGAGGERKFVPRGGGRGVAGGGRGGVGGRGGDDGGDSESCYKCGANDHFARDCPHKKNTCS